MPPPRTDVIFVKLHFRRPHLEMSLVKSASIPRSETALNLLEPVVEIEESQLSSALTIEQLDDAEEGQEGETPFTTTTTTTSDINLESASSSAHFDTNKRMMRLVRNREAAKK